MEKLTTRAKILPLSVYHGIVLVPLHHIDIWDRQQYEIKPRMFPDPVWPTISYPSPPSCQLNHILPKFSDTNLAEPPPQDYSLMQVDEYTLLSWYP